MGKDISMCFQAPEFLNDFSKILENASQLILHSYNSQLEQFLQDHNANPDSYHLVIYIFPGFLRSGRIIDRLAVLIPKEDEPMGSSWLTMDEAISKYPNRRIVIDVKV